MEEQVPTSWDMGRGCFNILEFGFGNVGENIFFGRKNKKNLGKIKILFESGADNSKCVAYWWNNVERCGGVGMLKR